MKFRRPIVEHKVIEIFGIEAGLILDFNVILPKIKKFIRETGLKVLAEKYHNFKPFGTTLIFILSSSHLAVHTWPEYRYLHMDLVTCARIPSNKKLTKVLGKTFQVLDKQVNIRRIKYCNRL